MVQTKGSFKLKGQFIAIVYNIVLLGGSSSMNVFVLHSLTNCKTIFCLPYIIQNMGLELSL